MRRLFGMAPAIGVLLASASVYAGVPKELEPLEFLLGEWEAFGGGKPGEAVGSAAFARGLQGRVIIRTSYAEYSASAQAPASRHDDLMVIYASEGTGIRADYYDNEGHAIRYAVTVAGQWEVSFISEIVSGAPRFRLNYKLGSDGILKGEFAMAPPGKPEAFARYLVWESRKTASCGAARPLGYPKP